jgi:hypothetical protein
MPARKKSKSNRLALEGTIPKIKLNMALDQKKIDAIQRCIKRGTLSITISKVDLVTGRIGDAWLYD